MSETVAGLLKIGLLLLALAAAYRPLGGYMARVFESDKHHRVERVAYRVMGVDPAADQRWPICGGYAILGAMTLLWGRDLVGVSVTEMKHPGAALQLAGASMEGKEARFGGQPFSDRSFQRDHRRTRLGRRSGAA